MEIDRNLRNELEASGRVWLRKAISKSDLSCFDEAASTQSNAGQRLRPSEALSQAVSINSSLMKAIMRIDAHAKPVRVVAFNKSEDANWGVPWHQDRVIAVTGRKHVQGYRNWTEKSGTWHCEPPQHILDQMLFVRVHLDDTDYSNGAMEIAVGSHKAGVVPSKSAQAEALKYPVEVCEAERGDVCVLKMLTLHTSKPASIQSGRRVLRVDFSSSVLPGPLAWADLDRERNRSK